MVDNVDRTDTVTKSDIVRNHSVDIIYYEGSGHELVSSLLESVLKLGSIFLLIVCSYLIDDLAKYAYTNALIDGCIGDIKVLDILSGERSTDELVAVDSSVTYNDNSLILVNLFHVTDFSYRMNLNGIDSCIFDLSCESRIELNALLGKNLTVGCNNILCSDVADDSVGKTELLIKLINTYSGQIILSGVEVESVQV